MNYLSCISLYSFRTKLLAAKLLIAQERTKFDIEQRFSIFLLQMMTQLSAANNTNPDMEFILREGSMYIKYYRDTRTDLWGTPRFNVLQAQKKFLVELGNVTSTFCFPFLTQHLKQSSATCRIP